MGELTDWFTSLPVFTRHWIGLTVVISLLAKLRILLPHSLVLDSSFFHSFHVWRPVTALFFYPVGLGLLINIYFLYRYSRKLETVEFARNKADFFFMLIFNWLCIVIIGFIWNLQVLMDGMVMSVLYVWCQLNKDTIVNFFFGTYFKAMYLPWAMLAFDFIVHDHSDVLFGIIVGHLYFFLAIQHPRETGGPPLIQTPEILYYYFPKERAVGYGFGSAPPKKSLS